ncbi:hypothetical protein BGW38_000290 [Lunasporangiospora selenospora]|uniref:3-hydroxyisobutyrate dehydrogenase n=1 Tax=Lunasporangiospora selenospora TaxID=979761 RepID=A0A9P6KF42_9FUNG|nr:hypothetical protein BGW38_000290 [Lunasporangiospora selenospora]
MTPDIKIGFIGLGEMGIHMAANLQTYLVSQSLPSITVWNRTQEKAAPVQALGAHVADTVDELVERSNVIFTCLSNDAVVETMYEQLFALVKRQDSPVTFVDTSTIYPSLPKKLAEDLAQISPMHTYLQCPVFGRPPAAKAAQLVWVASGDAKAIERLNPYFMAMSKSIIDLKTSDVSRGSALKLLGNFFIVGSVELLAEGFNFAERANLDKEAVLTWVRTVFPAPPWIGYSQIIADGSMAKAGGFAADLGLKDVNHMRQLASESGAYLPSADLAQKHLQTVHEKGMGDQDWTAILHVVREMSEPKNREE